MRKKFLSALLSLCMVLTLLPCEAFAAGTDTHTHQYTVLVSVLQKGNCATGEKGIAKYKCSVEGCTKTTYKTVDAGHTEPASGVTTVPATCGKDGSKSYTCTVCSQAVTEVLPATGQHTPGEGQIIPATCTEPAMVGKACTVCGAKLGEAEEVEGSKPLGHNFKDVVIQAPTCTETGTSVSKCTRCGEVNPDESDEKTIPAAGHKWVDDGAFQPATCEHPGQQPQKCSVCGITQMEIATNDDGEPVQPQLDHSYGAETKTPATCTDPAYITKTCSACGHVDKQIDSTDNNGQSLGHDWDSGEPVDATCTTGGYTLQTCQRCGETQKVNETSVNPNAHEIDLEKSTELSAPNCATGQNGVYKAVCKYCGKSMGYKAVPYEHNYEGAETTVTTPATCTTEGSGTKACQNPGCTHVETVVIPKSAHEWQAIGGVQPGEDGWVVTKAATCGEDGAKSRDCANCDEEDATDTPIPATGAHVFDEVIKQPNCQHGLQVGSYCTVCGTADPDMEAPFESGDPVAHSYTVRVDDECEAATCTTAGKTVMKCQWCDDKQETEVPALGHIEPDNPEIVPGDCTTAMKVKFHCTRCDTDVETPVEVEGFVPGEHEWGNWNITQEAKCGVAGSKTHTCTKCGKIEIEEIAALEHDYQETTIPATCAEGAYTVQECTLCHDVKAETKTPVNGSSPDASKHVYESANSIQVLQSATCTTNGVERRTCDNCHKVSYVSVVAAHDWDEANAIVSKDPTCTEAGEKTVSCKNCDATKTEEIVALEHDYVEDPEQSEYTACGGGTKVSVCSRCDDKKTESVAGDGNHNFVEPTEPMIPATCTEGGKAAGWTCSVCGEEDPDHPSEDLGDEVSPALGHAWDKWVETSAPTCEAVGSEELYCSRCDAKAAEAVGDDTVPAETTREIPMLDHVEGSVPVVVLGDCETGSVVKFTCSLCNKEVSVPIEDGTGEGNHSWDTNAVGADGNGWVVTTEATCSAEGVKSRTCTVCGKTEEESIAKTAHTKVQETVAATCTTGSYTVTKCSVCQTVISETTPGSDIDAKNHVFDENAASNILQEATCTTSGVERKTCTLCHKAVYVSIPAGHKWNDGVVTKPATCEADGEKTATCTVCGATDTVKIDAIGHDYSGDPVIVEATCGSDGSKTWTCKHGCGTPKVETITATGEHDWQEDFYIPATCTENAKSGKVCTVCGATDGELQEMEGTKLGHSWSAWEVTTAETCTTDGEEARHCTREGCDATETRTIAAHHTPGESEFTPATCTEGAKDVVKCAVCGEKISEEDLADIAPALGHKEKVIETPSTCETPGTSKTICERCGEVLVAEHELALSDHDYDLVTLQESTCSVAGVARKVCKVCGKSGGYTALPLADHTWGEEEVRTVDGKQEIWHTCGVCGAEEKVGDVDDPTPSCDHTWEIDPDDSTKHKCSKCSATEAHDYGSGETCTKCGAAKPTDPVCQHTNTEVVDAKAATCTEDGSTGKTVCTDCGATVTEAQTIPATGHDYVTGVYEDESDLDEDGYPKEKPGKQCSKCGDIVFDAVDPAIMPASDSSNGIDPNAESDPAEPDPTEPDPIETEPVEPAAE